MTTLLALSSLAVAALAVAYVTVRRRNLVADVERFQHARALTTSWSGESQQPVPPPVQEPDEQP